MSTQEVKELVADVLGVPLAIWRPGRINEEITAARQIALLIMCEEGFSIPEITEALDCDRTSFYYMRIQVDDRLTYWKSYKTKYLACIARITEKEEI